MTDALWTTHTVAAAVAGTAAAPADLTGIAIDSRDVVPGDLFIALPGTQADGHRFVAAGLAAGAAAALVKSDCPGVAAQDPRLIRCGDTGRALHALARAARDRQAGRRVAVTGSAGKTSTCRMLAAALSCQVRVHASARSFNNHVGVPLSLARMPADTDIGIFEVGMNRPGEIAPLAAQVAPELGLVTSVGPAHIEAFGNEAGIADEKGSLYGEIAAGGTAIVNLDGGHADRLLAMAKASPAARILTISMTDQAGDVRVQAAAFRPDCSCLTVTVGATRLMLKVGLPGRAMAMNALCVLAAMWALDGDLGLAGLQLANLRPGAGRGRVFQAPLRRGTATIIDESYNANPLSLRAALGTLAAVEPAGRGRRIAVLGDMEELGDAAAAHHLALADALAAADIAEVIAFGPLSAALGRAAGCRVTEADDPNDAAAVRARLRPGDVVMIKASNAAGLSALVRSLDMPPGRSAADPIWATAGRAA